MGTTQSKAELVLARKFGDYRIDPVTVLLIAKIILFVISVFLKWKLNGKETIDYLNKSKGLFGFFKRRSIRKEIKINDSDIDVWLPFIIDVLSESTVSELNDIGRKAQSEGYYNG